MLEENQICPLCHSGDWRYYSEDGRRKYLQCSRCELVFVPPHYQLHEADEKAQYDFHQNDIHDPAYRKFLSRLFDPLSLKLTDKIPAETEGLDFGCGPGPALAEMFKERGYQMALYDKFYAPEISVLDRQFDFITATEVVEHLAEAGEVLDKLWQALKPGAYLGVMTKLNLGLNTFNHWHYKNDPTHISFFSQQTWRYWAQQKSAKLEFVAADTLILEKQKSSVIDE